MSIISIWDVDMLNVKAHFLKKQAKKQIIQKLCLSHSKTPLKSGIYIGDVLEVLENLPKEHKFDLVIADPPYNIGKDFGTSSDSMPLAEYIAWTKKWLNACFALLTDQGLIYVYGFTEILAHIACQYPMENQRWLVWHYTNKTVPSLKFWQRSYESILCLWKPGTKQPHLEIDQIREPYTSTFLNNAAGKIRQSTVSRFGGNKDQKTIYQAHKKGALPRDVIKVPALAGGAGALERWFMCHDCGDVVLHPSKLKAHKQHKTFKHPTQKPMRLTKKLIDSRISGQRGRVLIPFAGSGSECLVAHQWGLDYLGIESNPLYVDFARKWIKAVCTN